MRKPTISPTDCQHYLTQAQVVTMESEISPTRDERQRRALHAEMLAEHHHRKIRRRELHAKRRFIRKAIPVTLI
jgi:hypothetical protein